MSKAKKSALDYLLENIDETGEQSTKAFVQRVGRKYLLGEIEFLDDIKGGAKHE